MELEKEEETQHNAFTLPPAPPCEGTAEGGHLQASKSIGGTTLAGTLILDS